MGSRMFHFGEYEGVEIDQVVEMDPAYVLWANENEDGHNISQQALARARRLLDAAPEDDDDDADLYGEISGLKFGASRYDWD